MPKRYSSDEVVRALERGGFVFVSQKGSHAKYRSVELPKRTVVVPMGKKQLQPGTFRSIVRQSGLPTSTFDAKS